jgi:1-acyl-sn-glycerol-3-phosphate acyltransferase
MDQDTSAYWRKLLALDQPGPVPSLDKYKSWHRHLRPLFYALLNLPLRYYFSVRIRGLENLPQKPPYIIAANHGSAMDYVCVAWAMGKRKEELYPMATKLFYDIGWARFWMRVGANVVRIDTVEDFFPALRMAAQLLKAGGAVYINPEGMRSTDAKILPFRPGVGVLAVETGVPLVPVHIGGSWKALPTGWILPRPYPVTVSFGKPILMESYQEKKKALQAYDIYKEVTEELRKRVLEMSFPRMRESIK